MKTKLWPDALATLCGVGLVPKAPGTFGTLAFFPVAVLALYLLSPFLYMGATVVLVILGVWASEAYGKGADLKSIVVDEACGLMVALFLLPLNWKCLFLGFLLFRLLDILKPFPISHLDRRVKGGFGVVLDDLVAGLATNAFIHFVVLRYMSSFL